MTSPLLLFSWSESSNIDTYRNLPEVIDQAASLSTERISKSVAVDNDDPVAVRWSFVKPWKLPRNAQRSIRPLRIFL